MMDVRWLLAWAQRFARNLWHALDSAVSGPGSPLSPADTNKVASWMVAGFPEDRTPFVDHGPLDGLQELFLALLMSIVDKAGGLEQVALLDGQS